MDALQSSQTSNEGTREYGAYQRDIYFQGMFHNATPTVTTDPNKLEAQAKERMSKDSFNYVAGGAGERATMDANRLAFRQWKVHRNARIAQQIFVIFVMENYARRARRFISDRSCFCSTSNLNENRLHENIVRSFVTNISQIIPRMLRDTNRRDLSVKLFGETYETPILIAPVGVQSIFHKDGEVGVAEAAAELDVPFILSTAASSSIEEVAKANGNGRRWYQLYWPQSDEFTISV